MLIPMINGLTNMLPDDRRDKLVHEQRFRFGVVVVFAFTVLLIVAGILLVPTYVFLNGSAHTKEDRLASLKSTLSFTEEAVLATRLGALSNSAIALTALSNNPSASGVLREALAISRPGITISRFVYTPSKGKALGVLELSGAAETRGALRNYQLAIQGTPFARSANLPVSAYAQDADIAFTITITLAP